MKCSLFALVASLGLASAFVTPALKAGSVQSRSKVMTMAVNDILGADVETGGVWDPLGFSKDEGSLYRNRQVELKHGRVAMMAILGTWFAAFHHPVFDGKVDSGLRALGQVPLAGWLQIVAAIGVVELTIGKQDTENKAPGDLGFGYAFNPFKNDASKFAELQLKELKNGRLAMVSVIGMWVQELVTGQTTIEQLQAGHFDPFGDGQGAF